MTSRTLLLGALLVCAFFIQHASAQDIPSAQQLLDSAHQISDLAQIGPYILKATLLVNPGNKKKEKTGKLTVSRDHDRARVELDLDGLHEVRIYLGSKQYIQNGAGALFISGFQEVDRLWDPEKTSRFHATSQYSLSEVKKEKLHGTEAWCVDKQYAHSKTRLCFAAATHALLNDRSNDSQKEFLEFTTIDEHVYPQRIRSAHTLLAPLELNHITVTPTPLEDATFRIPANALELERCSDMKPVKRLSGLEPSFPDEARRERKSAEIVLYGIVTKEGKVADAIAVDSDSFGFSIQSRDAMRNWVFQPATCDGHPVNSEMMVNFSFTIR
jgi:hypothetical protein